MRGGFLDVPQRDAGVEGGGDERVPQRVRPDLLGDPGAAGDPADDPPGAVPVQPLPVGGQEDRPVAAFADGQVDRPGGARRERDGDDLAALAGDHQGAVAAFEAEGLDVGADGFGDPQPVERQQRDQRVLGGRAEPGGDQQRADLVAVQADRVRLVVQPGTADVRGRGVLEQFFLDGVAVEPGDGAQPAGDRGPGAAAGLQVAAEALDVGPAGLEQAQRDAAGTSWRTAADPARTPRGSGRCSRPGTRPGRAAR